MKGFSKATPAERNLVIQGLQATVHKQIHVEDRQKSFHRWSIELPIECKNHFMFYKFLKKNFGEPSYSTIPKINKKYTNIYYKKYGTEKQQWEYFIKTQNGFINVYDKERSYIYFFGYTELKENDKIYNNREMSDITPINIETDNRIPSNFQNDLKNFLDDLKNYCSKFKNNNKLNEGVIILNPYNIHFQNFKYHIRLLKKTYKILERRYYPVYSQVLENAHYLASSAFILLMASFEGFIELLYTIFLKKEIDKDSKEFIISQKLEKKIKLLSIFCDEFKRFDKSFIKSKEYTDFTELKIRNKLLHGNIADTRIIFIFEEDGFLFYLDEQQKDFPFYGKSKYEFLPETIEFFDNAEKAIKIMIREVISMISIKKRKHIRRLLNEEWIGYVKTENGIEFVTEQIW